MSQNAIFQWLADPVRVLAALIRAAGLSCLLAALVLKGFEGLIFAYIGWLAFKGLRNAESETLCK